MRIFNFPNRFCDDSKPYWILFSVFLVSNALLIYTLYTKQPERYRGFSEWFSFEFNTLHRNYDATIAEPAHLYLSSGAIQETGAFNLQDANPATQNTTQLLGMILKDVHRPSLRKLQGPQASGVQISSIRKDSLCFLCGLRKGDIIISLNRIPTQGTVALHRAYASTGADGQGLLFDVSRRGKRFYITVEGTNIAR